MKPLQMPSDEMSERLIIGRIINSVNDLNIVMDKLQVEDFYFTQCQQLFLTIKALFLDEVEVSVETIFSLSKKFEKKIDMGFIMQIAQEGYATIDIEYYVENIKDLSNKRNLIHLSKEIIEKSSSQDKSEIIYKSFQEKADCLFNSSTNTNYLNIGQILDGTDRDDGLSILQWVEKRQEMAAKGLSTMEGTPTTYPLLDEALDGLNKGHYIIIGARPGVGKTTFILNLVHLLANVSKAKIGFFSLEMSANELVLKLISICTGINSRKIKDGKISGFEFQELNEAARILQNRPIFIDDQGGIKISQLCSRAKRMKTNHDIDVLFIDYLSLIQGDKGKYTSKQEEIQEVSNKLRTLAKDLKIPIVCISQLNRESEKEKRAPKKSDLRESGQIEQDAHSILILHRPEVEKVYDQPGLLQLYIVKNRFGQEKQIDYSFSMHSGVITELKTIKQMKEDLDEEKNEFEGFTPKSK